MTSWSIVLGIAIGSQSDYCCGGGAEPVGVVVTMLLYHRATIDFNCVSEKGAQGDRQFCWISNLVARGTIAGS